MMKLRPHVRDPSCPAASTLLILLLSAVRALSLTTHPDKSPPKDRDKAEARFKAMQKGSERAVSVRHIVTSFASVLQRKRLCWIR